MKGVSFGGTEDKQYTRMPNHGNECAFPGCIRGKAIPEGYPARFALGDPTKWCHKECADQWEAMGGTPAPEVIEEAKEKCGAPHPELHDFLCAKDEHMDTKDYYHSSGAGHSWYMEPGQVSALKMQLAARNAPQPMSEPEVQVPDDHVCCGHCNPNGHAPHEDGCPPVTAEEHEQARQKLLTAWGVTPEEMEAIENDGGYATARKQADAEREVLVESMNATIENINDKLRDARGNKIEGLRFENAGPVNITEPALKLPGTTYEVATPEPKASTVVRLTFELIEILKNHGITNDDLVAELMDWRAQR